MRAKEVMLLSAACSFKHNPSKSFCVPAGPTELSVCSRKFRQACHGACLAEWWEWVCLWTCNRLTPVLHAEGKAPLLVPHKALSLHKHVSALSVSLRAAMATSCFSVNCPTVWWPIVLLWKQMGVKFKLKLKGNLLQKITPVINPEFGCYMHCIKEFGNINPC